VTKFCSFETTSEAIVVIYFECGECVNGFYT
jgi:hypothetical protein